MSASVLTGGQSSGWRAIAQSVAQRCGRFYRMRAQEAFPASSSGKGLSPEEFASYLMLMAAHI